MKKEFVFETERGVNVHRLPKVLRVLAPEGHRLPAGTDMKVTVDVEERTATLAFTGFEPLATFNKLPVQYPALTLRQYTGRMGNVFASQDL